MTYNVILGNPSIVDPLILTLPAVLKEKLGSTRARSRKFAFIKK